jgi:hypothetical protein
MLKIEKVVTPSWEQWEIIIEGMRNPKNSWDRIDSKFDVRSSDTEIFLGVNDEKLMRTLVAGGPVHAKFRRMIPVFITLSAPLYWWKEADTYRIGTVRNSCSTMHKIQAKEFTLEDFSTENLNDYALQNLKQTIEVLNYNRERFLKTKDKEYWWQLIQLLPSSYNQKATIMVNYEVLYNMYMWRKNHKLDEWHTFCDMIETLPYANILITLQPGIGEQ